MDYLAATYPGRPWSTNVRVGPIDPHVPRDGLSEAERRLMGNFRRYADAVVDEGVGLVVVETTMLKVVGKIGPLLEYLRLVPDTPEHPEWRGRVMRGELVSPIPDPRAEALCQEVGLRFVHFSVSWLADFLDQYAGRFRRAPLSGVRQSFVRE